MKTFYLCPECKSNYLFPLMGGKVECLTCKHEGTMQDFQSTTAATCREVYNVLWKTCMNGTKHTSLSLDKRRRLAAVHAVTETNRAWRDQWKQQ